MEANKYSPNEPIKVLSNALLAQVQADSGTLTHSELQLLVQALERACDRDLLRKHQTAGVQPVRYQGKGPIDPKWNVSLYTSGKKPKWVSCDPWVLAQICLENWAAFEVDAQQPVIQIDDAGWGCPLGGVMVGVIADNKLTTGIVDVEHFRNGNFKTKTYLMAYAEIGFGLVQGVSEDPQKYRVEICTGYINKSLRNLLRAKGYTVRCCEIKGALQDRLEEAHARYLAELTGGAIRDYDPKALSKGHLLKTFNIAMEYAKQHPELYKDGWSRQLA